MRHKSPVSGRTDHEVDVCWSEGMAPQSLQELACGPVTGNRIAHRQDRPELVLATLVGPEGGPKVPARLIMVLNVVKLVDRCLPNFHLRADNWYAALIGDSSFHDQRRAVLLTQKDRVAFVELALRTCVERPQDR